MKSYSGYKLFGWRGFSFRVPKDWDLAVDGGSYKSGYMRLDDPIRPRLELRWEYIPFEKAKEPREVAEKYFETLKERIKKRAKELAKTRKVSIKEIKIPELKVLNKGELKVNNHDAYFMYIKGPEDAIYVTWYCEKVEKQISLQLNFKASEYYNQKRILDVILKSFSCHSTDGFNFWYIYGLLTYIPETFHLSSRKLTTALSYLTFYEEKNRKRTGRHLVIAYSGMANILLEDYYENLFDWFKKNLLKNVINNIAKVSIKQCKDISVKGHDKGCYLYGESLSFFKSRKYYLNAYVWLCEERNRIICLATLIKGDSSKNFLNSILEKTRCH